MDVNSIIIITYDIENKKFSFSDTAKELFSLDGEPQDFFNSILRHHFLSTFDNHIFMDRLEDICNKDTIDFVYERFSLKNLQQELRVFGFYFLSIIPKKVITLTMKDVSDDIEYVNHLTRMTEYDELTGLMNLDTFKKNIENYLRLSNVIRSEQKYAIVYFDILKFKAINDIFGKSGGDIVLLHISTILKNLLEDGEFSCRIIGDRFAIFVNSSNKDIVSFVEKLLDRIAQCELPITVNCNAGIYVITDTNAPASVMIDKAILAQSTIKGNYAQKYKVYTEEIRDQMLSEQEIVGSMAQALKSKQFIPYFQPQYDHSSGNLVGAEALVRWKHPDKGLIRPDLFIPIFEKNGFITILDMYIFERACEFLRKCIDLGISPVPVSTNFSRYDIFQPDFVEKLEISRKKYNVPVELVRIEITESAVFGGSENTNRIVQKLHTHGYIVEMDDFGSGYSSLNVLKDVDFDIIKLDMKFLSDDREHGKGGTVISSVVHMAKWLKLAVIAEGVETTAQADFLKSIGADLIQGYLYSKPLPEEDFIQLLKTSSPKRLENSNTDIKSKVDFWNPQSQETLIFNQFVGPAAIFQYQKGYIEILRVNPKYIKEFNMNLSEKEIMSANFFDCMDSDNKKIYIDAIERVIKNDKEVSCETWRTITSGCCGKEKICIRTDLRILEKAKDSYMIYALIRNLTSEKQELNELKDSKKRFEVASEQAKIFYWEYDVKTKNMTPCIRCKRELGLPELVENYPEPVIESGLIPADYANLYRGMHKKIEEGVPEQEEIIPLTANRIPFLIHYTTEFDSQGKPIKAYGSAAQLYPNTPKKGD